MKKVVIINVLLIIIGLLFYQFNAALYGFIHFNQVQSLFTRNDYFIGFIIVSCLFFLVLWVTVLIRKKTKDDEYLRIIDYELLILTIIGAVSAVGYIYYVYYPVVPQIINLVFSPSYKEYSFIYLVEFVILLNVLSQITSKSSMNNKVERYIKSLEIVILFLALITPVFIDSGEWTWVSLFTSRFVEENYLVFVFFPILYILYYLIRSEKMKIVLNLCLVLLIFIVLLLPKNPEDYFFTERLHLNVRPFVSFYVHTIMMIIISIDIYRLQSRRSKIMQ